MIRVLIFNFFGGVMDRGIPVYAENIGICMQRVGFEPVELRCPGWLRGAPRPIRNAAFVLFEQVVAPAMRVLWRCSLTVYPYNSAGVVDALLGRSVLVVHDLLSHRRGNRALSARYVRFTQAIHAALGRPVCAASERTLTCLRRLKRFAACPLRLWSNSFYSFESALADCQEGVPLTSNRRTRVLLCSGIGPNKDYAGAIKIFRRSKALREAELRIIGFGNDAALARRRIQRLPPAVRERIHVLPRLSLREVIAEYRKSDVVWVHSKDEGFGRFVIEARLCGRPVVASRIGAFRRFARFGVCFYRKEEVDLAVRAALATSSDGPVPDLHDYHAPLEAAVSNLVAAICGRYALLQTMHDTTIPEEQVENRARLETDRAQRAKIRPPEAAATSAQRS